jgi:hypothetical protein
LSTSWVKAFVFFVNQFFLILNVNFTVFVIVAF